MECYACGMPVQVVLRRKGIFKCIHMIDETYEERCPNCKTLLYGFSRPIQRQLMEM